MIKGVMLDVIGTCVISVGSAVIGAVVAVCIKQKGRGAFNKKLIRYLELNNSVTNCMKDIVISNNNRVDDLASKVNDLQRKLDIVE